MCTDTRLSGLKLRFAEIGDIGLIMEFIKALAAYESLQHEVIATEDVLKDSLFNRKIAEAVIAEYEGKPAGFALYYYSLSTFIGIPAVYLEDLFVYPEMRGRGIGTIMFEYLAKLAAERDCWGLEWACLDWNEPSIGFYKSLGAKPRDEWTTYRLRGKELKELADRFDY